ncbi:sigma-70 family RNA polymerase sigma factor [Micromonospora taraxaci]|uniref:sigma-70 family RNA polymerase sigma factor n=1 Tax=Micromonospora taraxaci TaxID=1316803 RepID=UPI00340DE7EF
MSPTAQPGDSDAQMRHLVATHCAPLTRFVSRMTLDVDQSTEDLVQETMIRAWRSNPTALTANEQTGRRWLFTVARHLVIDHYRRTRARPLEATPSADGVTADDSTASEALANVALSEAVRNLSREHHEVLMEVLIENRPAPEVAARLGIPVGTVRSRLHYAVRSLREAVLD